ncbi:Detected protein of unknown function [Hibiscus syriacus]|uniref:DC1 domain-containing protein n=1 Tax=Hibiscus syriacus TaxID=106335 RepID=A0A6A2WZK2_HIBSY|nr:uncharacterized protein LOC120188012 [Hibiscus syriacus]KAE8661220.1 Detected protein of unknown function [Hibiscus syriacus]
MEELQEEHIYHFSHQHPILHTTGSIPDGDIICSGCKLSILPANGYYTCKTCPFYLHQVCYNMPRKTRHPSHPNHLLTLHVVPSDSDRTFECRACGHPVNGFYYNCAECCICYHVLCSALPLSVSITCHLHTLKLEFSPPFDLQCDICQKLAIYNGWLYRCQICEFDAHLACAILNQITQSFRHPPALLADSSTTKIKHSSASLMETKQRENFINEGTELMQLVSLGVTRNNNDNTVVGWHQRLHGPKKKLTTGNGQDVHTGSTSPVRKVQETDQSSLLSSDTSMEPTPSYQFSDGCFSIDLAGSYSSFDHTIQARKESKVSDSDATAPGKGKETTIERKNMLDRITSNLEPPKQETIYGKKESFDSRMSEAFLSRNRTHSEEQGNRKKLSNESRSMPGVGNQSNKSENVSASNHISCISSEFP